MQRALIQYRDPKNRELVREALEKCGRRNLIGYGPKCLLRPEGGNPRERGEQKNEFRKNIPAKKAGGKKKTIRNVHKKK